MSNIIKTYYSDLAELHICDINPRELVAASKIADRFHRVPNISDNNYKQKMLHLLKEEGIDFIVPLIDYDLFTFSKDDEELNEIGVRSTGPMKSTASLLCDKKQMALFLKKNGIHTPRLYEPEEACNNKKYVIKPKLGYGSKGFRIISGAELKTAYTTYDDIIIQEFCADSEEITAEVFNKSGKLQIFCRRRIETKEGVCTKMQCVNEPEIVGIIKELVNLLEMPTAFCVQFMKHKQHWNMIDCNLRIGAGTAMATASGFQLTRAFFADLLDVQVRDDWFAVDDSIKAVVRVYREEVMR